MVVVSAVGFGYALFGFRPVPQPAMPETPGHPIDPDGSPGPERRPSESQADVPAPINRQALVTAGASVERASVEGSAARSDVGLVSDLRVGRLRAALQREPSADHQPANDATLSPWVRVRSALILAIVVGGIAALIGVLASIVLVAGVLLVT